jgi:hypothetical protein
MLKERITMARVMTALAKGAATGLAAGIPQVLVTKAQARLLGLPDEQADFGPRFVGKLGQHANTPPGRTQRWLLATGFHFGYAGLWGALYAGLQRWRPAQPHVGGPLLASLIYALAFSPWGVATQAGVEKPVESRPARESVLHWTAALSFSLALAYLFERLGGQPRQTKREGTITHSVRP